MASEGDEDDPQKKRRSFFVTELLQSCGAQSPLLRQAGHGFYDSLLTHSISVDHESPGRFVCTLRVPARLCNADGLLHGGAITSLVDVIGSAPLYSMGLPHSGLSVSINVTSIAGACLGEEIEIEAKALRIWKSLAVMAVDIRLKGTGKLVAQGRHTKFVATSMDGHSRL